MKPMPFPESQGEVGKGQPDYIPLPAHFVDGDKQGRLVCCWQLSLKERIILLFTGRIWHEILTFYNPLQPQHLTVIKPLMNKPKTPQPKETNPHESN